MSRFGRSCLIPPSGAVTILTLSACAVGPDYRPPAAPAVEGYTQEALPARTANPGGTGGEAQHLLPGGDLPGQWWTLFGSSQITALVSQAMASYPDIVAQQAALRGAQQALRAEAGSFMPQVQGTVNGNRSEVSGGAIFPGLPNFFSDVFQGTVNVSYTFDIFGKERRTVEGLRARAVQQSFQLEASYLTLTSNVVLAAVQVASTRKQIQETQGIIALEEQQLSVVRRRYELGVRTEADVLQQQANLDSVRATLPPLQQQLAAAQHALAVLTGRYPKDVEPLQLALSDLKLPQEIPVSLPSSLVGQRPDIRAQAAAVQAANAQIGVATANMLPSLTLNGQLGDETSRSISNLISPGSTIWNIGGSLAQPLFEGGTLRARKRGAVAAYEQAGAQYRLTVLQAFQNVADALTQLYNDAQRLETQRDALEAASGGLQIVQKQYDAGAVDFVALLAAQQTYQQALLALVRGTAARYTDTVVLFQALGGGWWNRNDPGVLSGLRPNAVGNR